jgi:hypothetical protein
VAGLRRQRDALDRIWNDGKSNLGRTSRRRVGYIQQMPKVTPSSSGLAPVFTALIARCSLVDQRAADRMGR